MITHLLTQKIQFMLQEEEGTMVFPRNHAKSIDLMDNNGAGN